ncbi:MAG: fatty acid desaturase [Myxococcota bacterium]|nr:fatty acid desaturase [Myxococcota bacterium]
MARPALKIDLRTVSLLAAQWTLFLGNFALYAAQALPLWAHMAITLLAIHLAFTIWHEAAHGTISNRRWLNDAAGILGMFPYTTPYFMQRHIHLEHHKYLNEEGRDPNLIYAGGPFWQLPIRYFSTIEYAKSVLERDPRSTAMRCSDYFFLLLVAGAYGFALWHGFLLDLVLIWFLPLVAAKLILDAYVNYLPHVGLPADRFLGTRILHVGWLTPLVLAHNYHAVHHLWPTIPWHGYLARFREKFDYLEEQGVPIERRLFGPRQRPQGGGEHDSSPRSAGPGSGG